MTMARGLTLAILLWLGLPAGSAETVTVVIESELGIIEVQLDPDRAPITVENFLRYVDSGHYDGGQFHRTVTMDNQPDNDVKIEVIQASVRQDKKDDGLPPIKLERTTETGLLHLDGVISMARDEPDSATSSFFFCIGDQPELDFGGKRNPDGQGFAAFGVVTKGSEVIRKIQRSKAEAQRLEPPIRILAVRRK